MATLLEMTTLFPPFNPTPGLPTSDWTVPIATNNYDGSLRNRISASLYLAPRHGCPVEFPTFDQPSLYIKNTGEWEKEYLMPLVTHINCQDLRWTFRVYVASNVPDRYIKTLLSTRCELFIMPYDPTWRHKHACLWRYLALADSLMTITCGADQPALDPVVYKALRLWIDSNDHALRWMKPIRPINRFGLVEYRPLNGGFACRTIPDIVSLLSAWTTQADLNLAYPTHLGMDDPSSIR